MSRSPADVLDDITAAIDAINAHLQFGPISLEIVMDAVAMRLLEIGEAVKGLTPELTALEPEIPWTNIARMRDFLAHHYFATNPEIVQAVIDKDLPPLREAVTHLRTTLPGDSSLTVNG